MASRTVVDSVPMVAGPPDGLEALEARLVALRERWPGVIVGRYLDRVPHVADDAWVAPGAALVGDVRLGAKVSVWFGCVLRGDVNRIEIGAHSNLQDGTVVHLGDDDPTIVGEEVVVGHRAVIHGCTIGGGTLVGIQATILDGVKIGEGCVIGAGALIPAGREIPPRSLVLGTPGKIVRTLTAADEDFHRKLAGKYVRLAHNYRVG
ncbi:gamma carbonic anhydrase family protein [Paraliomyxa miuraensis]|uniref:gamma carbonic anhydrase family protein n=1 Tax=Paraliomyxa miuraensis TaxID=376150 RepID=UPI0022598F0B|nr:gamma carbonic anhydrase family protein [Paraliomyxa miuraensis]MCX4242904.1 gamma carbonic anhydrase family protein [Paraliomyxa miuraensis]